MTVGYEMCHSAWHVDCPILIPEDITRLNDKRIGTMKKMRLTLFALLCVAGTLTACGESPVAPSAELPLVGAQAKGGKAGGMQSDTTDTGSKKKNDPRQKNSGYVIAM